MIRKNILAILLLAPLLFLKPAAAVAAEQPETVCIQCHGSMPDRLGAPVNLWRGSIHAENGISCNGCHGGDPKDAANAMSPQRGFLGAPKEKDIPAFCGRCHPGVYKDYLASAHGRALGAGGPTCVTCHSNHQVMKASLALINEKSCTRCHSFERAKAIRDAMSGTEARIVGISGRIAQFQVSGVDTEKMGKALFAVRNRFHTLFHDVDVNRVKNESAAINKELDKLDAALKVIDDEHARRRVVGGIAVAAALLLAILFHLMKKTYD
ncbi:MAG: cytochrome C [Geobacter sp.]|uniref:cytochrome c3 family protein n=1 Tax=Geomonas ferrireducens TaxID=2570227 RepID=UPI0010A8226E|nr:cytochrome c3 family protein [Geomonas ferrireducens]TSK04979.1 MAG: cytochrome C [Geobacter sp.]